MKQNTAGAKQGFTLGVAGFLPILSILSLAPAVPTIIAHFKDVPHAAFLVPLMVTTPGLMVALLSPGAGWIADRFGRRRPLLWATFFYGFSGIAPFFLNDMWVIFLCRLFVGLSETFILVIVYALFADYFPENRRRNWLTIQGLLGPALGAMSLAGAGWLSTIYWNGVFLIYGSAFLIYFAMLAWFFEPDRRVEEAETVAVYTPFPWKTIVLVCSITLFTSIVFYVFLVNGAIAFGAIGTNSASRVGIIMGLVSLGVPSGALLFNILSRRIPIEALVSLLLALLGLGTLGIGLSRSEGMMALFAVIQEIGAGMTGTGLVFWASAMLPVEHRGRGFGMWTSSFFVAQFISPAIVGALTAATGSILTSFTIMGAAALAGALVVLAISQRSLAKPQPASI